MDDAQMNRLLMQKVGKKFYGHDTLNSKYDPQIPASAEREYVRTTNAYMAILKTELEEQLPKLKEVYKENRDAEVQENRRNDSATDLMLAISQIFATIKNNVIARTAGFGLRRKLESLAHLNRKLTVKEWKKAIKATLGIDIREDYYLGDFYIEQLRKWIEENVGLISSIPEDSLEKMKDIVYDGFTNGKTTTRMVKEIQRAYSISRRRAELIARDQTAKLNGQIQMAQQQDAGITEYVWSTTGDERVRRSHQELNGKKFSWDDPPENSDGRKCHPGQDFQCRCIGRPIFNKGMSLPFLDDKTERISTHNAISTTNIKEINASDFKKGKNSFELTQDVMDLHLTDTARERIKVATEQIKTAEDLKNYLKKKGIDLEIPYEPLQRNMTKEIASVKKQADYIVAAIEQYEEFGGLSRLKSIHMYDVDLDVQAQYSYRAKGEAAVFDEGHLYISDRANGFQVMHEFAHAFADSTRPEEYDLVEWSEILNKQSGLSEEATAYFGANNSVIEAEKFADAIGGAIAYGNGNNDKLVFVSNVANFINKRRLGKWMK